MLKLRWTLWWQWLVRYRGWRVDPVPSLTLITSLRLNRWIFGVHTNKHHYQFAAGYARYAYICFGPVEICLARRVD